MDLATTKAYKIVLLPTFIVRYKGKEVVLKNYQSVDDFEKAIQTLSDKEIVADVPEASAESVLQFVRAYGRVVPIEIIMAFAMDEKETMILLRILEQKNLISIHTAGNGMWIDAIT